MKLDEFTKRRLLNEIETMRALLAAGSPPDDLDIRGILVTSQPALERYKETLEKGYLKIGPWIECQLERKKQYETRYRFTAHPYSRPLLLETENANGGVMLVKAMAANIIIAERVSLDWLERPQVHFAMTPANQGTLTLLSTKTRAMRFRWHYLVTCCEAEEQCTHWCEACESWFSNPHKTGKDHYQIP